MGMPSAPPGSRALWSVTSAWAMMSDTDPRNPASVAKMTCTVLHCELVYQTALPAGRPRASLSLTPTARLCELLACWTPGLPGGAAGSISAAALGDTSNETAWIWLLQAHAAFG